MKQLIRTATESALSVPEILSLVFSYGSPQAQAACACVCKKWSEIALGELWRNIEDIHPLLKLAISSESFYDRYDRWASIDEHTSRMLRKADWPRFRQYATRVKSISFDENEVEISPPKREGIALLCLHHPYGHCLTPNARTLRWTLSFDATITTMIPFISQCLEELRLEINLSAIAYTRPEEDVFIELTHRTPTLKRLSIESKSSASAVSSSFSSWIQTCLGLEKAHIPRQWQTEPVVVAFGSLPKLFDFGITWGHPPDGHRGLALKMDVGEGHFPSLQRLGWSSDIKEAKDLLHQTPSGLRGLTLDCPAFFQSQVEVVAFIAAAAQRYPDLDSVCLNFTNFVDSMEPDEPNLLQLSLEIIRPLLACKRLRELRIHYPGPFILSISELGEMGAAWPNMEELVLCPDPNDGWYSEEQGTAISRLPHIAAAFPQLRLLGLYFDYIDPPGSAGDLLPETQFRCLRELNVGASLVPSGNSASVGLYLASLFAVGTRPSITATASDARSQYFAGSLASEQWEEIESWVHLTMGVKEAFMCRLSGH